MRGLVAILAVVWTLLLCAIAVELYRIDKSLAWISAPIQGIAAMAGATNRPAVVETREQRIERKAREQHEATDETVAVLTRAMELDRQGKGATAQRPRKR